MIRPTMTAVVAVLSLLGVTTAVAAPIAFSSNGGFASISGCNNGTVGCRISSDGNVLNMSGVNNSTLTANDFSSGAFTTNADDRIIGEITWVNRASSSTDQNFNVNYVLNLVFTLPTADMAGQTFNLNVQQPTNPVGDLINGFTISGLPSTFNLGGVHVSDFRFSGIGSGSFSNGLWSNPEGGTSVLRLTADFTAVPEPAALSLFSAGLLGVAALRRRQQRKAA